MRIIGYVICKKSKVDKDAPVLENRKLDAGAVTLTLITC